MGIPERKVPSKSMEDYLYMLIYFNAGSIIYGSFPQIFFYTAGKSGLVICHEIFLNSNYTITGLFKTILVKIKNQGHNNETLFKVLPH
jgi:hypothetical protein